MLERPVRFFLRWALVSTLGLVVLVRCTPRQEAKTIQGIGEVTTCVLEHDGESPEDIAAHCAGVTVREVFQIITAHRASMAKRSCVPITDAGVSTRDVQYGPGK